MSVHDAFAHIGQALRNLGAEEALLLGLEETVKQLPPAPDLSLYATAADVTALAGRVTALESAAPSSGPTGGPFALASDLAALDVRVTEIETDIEAIDPGPNADGISITTTDLGAMTVGFPVNVTLAFAGGTAPYQPSILTGAFPDGVSMAAGGLITGTPTTAAPYDVTVQAHDANGLAGVQEFTGTVAAAPPAP